MVLTREDILIEISERLKVMRMQETSHYAVPDYLDEKWQRRLSGDSMLEQGVNLGVAPSHQPAVVESSSGEETSSKGKLPCEINQFCREKICEWMYLVIDHFDFNREVVTIAISYLDRYLATRTVNRRIFQLAAMTSLFLAVKLHEPSGKLRMSSVIELSRGNFMPEHIVAMEDAMLDSLKWHVHPPTPLAFCRDLMRLVSGDVPSLVRHDINELTRFLTELSVCDYWFVTKRPSVIAFAAIVNAMELQGPERVDPRCMVKFMRHVVEMGMDIDNDDEIIECYQRLRQLYVAGGYTPNLDTAEELCPVELVDGRQDIDDINEEPQAPPAARDRAQVVEVSPVAARAVSVSPIAVNITASQLMSQKRTPPYAQDIEAKRARRSLNRELEELANKAA